MSKQFVRQDDGANRIVAWVDTATSRCTGSIWWSGPGEYIRVTRSGPDPFVGMSTDDLQACGFRATGYTSDDKDAE